MELLFSVALYCVEIVISIFLIRFMLDQHAIEASNAKIFTFTGTWIVLLALSDIGLSEGVNWSYGMAFGWLLLVVPWLLIFLFFRTNGDDTFSIGFVWFTGTHVLPWIFFMIVSTLFV